MICFDNDILSIFPSPFISTFFMYLVAKADDDGNVNTSLRKMSAETGWDINHLRSAIEELTSLHTIYTQVTHRGTIITISVIDTCRDKSDRVTHSLHTKHTPKPKSEAVSDELTFDYVWDMYKKKVGRSQKLVSKWNALSYEDRKKAAEFIPAYVALTEEVYRKQFQTFLNQRSWEDEKIYTNNIAVPFGSFNPKLVSDPNLFPQFIERFNMKVRGTGIPTVDMAKGLTEKRRVLFNIAYCLHFYEIKDVVDKAIRNPRYNGSTGFTADFDYIFEPNNFLRISEGK